MQWFSFMVFLTLAGCENFRVEAIDLAKPVVLRQKSRRKPKFYWDQGRFSESWPPLPDIQRPTKRFLGHVIICENHRILEVFLLVYDQLHTVFWPILKDKLGMVRLLLKTKSLCLLLPIVFATTIFAGTWEDLFSLILQLTRVPSNGPNRSPMLHAQTFIVHLIGQQHTPIGAKSLLNRDARLRATHKSR